MLDFLVGCVPFSSAILASSIILALRITVEHPDLLLNLLACASCGNQPQLRLLAQRLILHAHLQGHSLGGSLGTLLMMMYKYRGVLPQTAIAPVYTFGAPAIFCEGACCAPCNDGSGSCDIKPDLKPDAGADAVAEASSTQVDTSATEPVTGDDGHVKSQGILQALGLEAGCVRNIFMSKDIVPRAFACDYTLVADLLRRVGEGFREHDCLMGNGRYIPVHSCMHPCVHSCVYLFVRLCCLFSVNTAQMHDSCLVQNGWQAARRLCSSCLPFGAQHAVGSVSPLYCH